MLFRRRKPLSLIEMIRSAFAPKSGYKRAVSYVFKRILRFSATPHAISAGVAAGVFASFTPFLGFHLLIAIVISIAIRGNYVVAGFSTLVGNPISFPFIWALNYNIGNLLVDGQTRTASAILNPLESVEKKHGSNFIVNGINNLWTMLTGEVGWTLLIGSIPCGIISAVAVYLITSKSVKIYRNSKIHLRRVERKQEGNKKMNDESSANLSE